jgi:hypothetical protein
MKVRIFKPHTHAGTRYLPGPDGLVIDVPADAAAFLRTHGAQGVASASAARADVSEPQPDSPQRP